MKKIFFVLTLFSCTFQQAEQDNTKLAVNTTFNIASVIAPAYAIRRPFLHAKRELLETFKLILSAHPNAQSFRNAFGWSALPVMASGPAMNIGLGALRYGLMYYGIRNIEKDFQLRNKIKTGIASLKVLNERIRA